MVTVILGTIFSTTVRKVTRFRLATMKITIGQNLIRIHIGNL